MKKSLSADYSGNGWHQYARDNKRFFIRGTIVEGLLSTIGRTVMIDLDEREAQRVLEGLQRRLNEYGEFTET